MTRRNRLRALWRSFWRFFGRRSLSGMAIVLITLSASLFFYPAQKAEAQWWSSSMSTSWRGNHHYHGGWYRPPYYGGWYYPPRYYSYWVPPPTYYWGGYYPFYPAYNGPWGSPTYYFPSYHGVYGYSYGYGYRYRSW